jgi:RecA-family ATPase
MRGATLFEPKADTPKLLRFFSGADAPLIKAVEWLVRGLLARGAITILAGQPGVSKSVHSFILAGCLCLGRDFAGMKVERRYKVLYLDIDGGWNWSAPTLVAAMRGVGLEGLPQNFLYWSPLDEVCQFEDEQSTNLEHLGGILETTVRNEKVDVVIIDSLNQFMEGDSNNNRDVVRALRGGLEGVRRAGAAILILDHTNKAARAWFMTRAPTL